MKNKQVFLKIIALINLILEFFTACIVAGLEFVHGNGVLHRDIKPENMVFESNGNFRKLYHSHIQIRVFKNH